MNPRKLFYAFAILALVVIALTWYYASRDPVSPHSHGQDSHTHEHTHDGITAHDHTHSRLSGKTTHSHPHVHQHVHEPRDFNKLGMTEVGHLHVGDGRTDYWVSVSANVENKTLSAEFWTGVEGSEKVQKITCDQKRLPCFLFIGGSSKNELTLVEESGVYVCQVPQDVVFLPNNILGVNSISFDGKEFPGFRAPIMVD